MSESVVDAGDVEETEKIKDFLGTVGPIFCFLPVLTFCVSY